jgi:hypothetical protein
VVYSVRQLVWIARNRQRKRGIALNNKRLLALLLSITPFAAQADALFGNEMAGDVKLPRTWGSR